MFHTYKRRRTSLKSSSFYESLSGDPLTECSPLSRPIEKSIPNDCCSKDAKEVSCNGWSKDDLVNNCNSLQSLHHEKFERQPIKFKYVRRYKSRFSNGTSMLYVERMAQMNAQQPDLDNTDCISFQSKLPVADPNQDIPGQDTTPCADDLLSGKQYEIGDKSLFPLENPGSLCCDFDSQNCCVYIAKEYEAGQVNSVSPGIGKLTGGSVPVKISDKEENKTGQDSSNICGKRGSESDCKSTSIMPKPNYTGLDTSRTADSSCQNYHNGIELECIAPLHTYTRRLRKCEYSSRIYADLLAERENSVSRDKIVVDRAGTHTQYDLPNIADQGISENVAERKASFSPPLEKLTDRISAIGAVISVQGNQKERNGCQLMDDVKASKVTALNSEVETVQQSDDAIKAPCAICDLTNEEPLTGTALDKTFKAALGNSQNQERAPVVLQKKSDKPDKVDLNLAASTECERVGLILRSKALKHSVGRINDSSSSAKAARAYTKELLETMKRGVTGTNGLPNLNFQPSNDDGFISQNSKVLYSVTLPNGSTNSKVLQLFPEGSTSSTLGTSNSGFTGAITYKSSSVTMALQDSSTSPHEFIQNKMSEPSSSQEMPKLLLDGIRSSNRPLMIDTEAFRQNFPAFASCWSEEELDNLWIGVRRHGKDNWFLILRDPKLRFSQWRTERDLAEKWVMEQTKLLGNSPSSHHQYAKPVGIPIPPPFMPPRPGSMTRYLTDPAHGSVSNPYLNNQGIMLPPMPPLNITNALGNETRTLNRRVRANRRSMHSESSWERFKARNDVTSLPEFPSPPRSSTSRNDILPPIVGTTFDLPKSRPPLPVVPQRPGNSSQFHDKVNHNVVDTSTMSVEPKQP